MYVYYIYIFLYMYIYISSHLLLCFSKRNDIFEKFQWLVQISSRRPVYTYICMCVLCTHIRIYLCPDSVHMCTLCTCRFSPHVYSIPMYEYRYAEIGSTCVLYTYVHVYFIHMYMCILFCTCTCVFYTHVHVYFIHMYMCILFCTRVHVHFIHMYMCILYTCILYTCTCVFYFIHVYMCILYTCTCAFYTQYMCIRYAEIQSTCVLYIHVHV